METNKLMVVEQIPIIKERLKEASKLVREKCEAAQKLAVTDENRKEVKRIRAELNKNFKEFEEQRKIVKNAILTPYNDFEKLYKQEIAELFIQADIDLKIKIAEIEDELIQTKKDEVLAYYQELCEAAKIDFIPFEKTGIKVNLSTSESGCKMECDFFVDKIKKDLLIIEKQENKDEVFHEYKMTLDVSDALEIVTERKKAIELRKIQEQEFIKRQQEEAERITKVDEAEMEFAPPVAVDKEPEQIFCVTFKVTGTKEQLKDLKEFMNERGMNYESK